MIMPHDVLPPRIGIVAGELSGDLLGSGLIRALRLFHPNAIIEGIGGENMLAVGFHSHYPLETLSVMGLVEVLKHYRAIKACRDTLRDYFLANPPDVFIGIDAPDFNLGLEQALRAAGIPTIHYVSPSVWAWREYRLRKIARACHLMLTLLPFEAHYYEKHSIPVRFVGHPLADDIPLQVDQRSARRALGLAEEGLWVALLPGSRSTEVCKLSIPFLQTAEWLTKCRPEIQFIVPLVNQRLRTLFSSYAAKYAPQLKFTLIDGQSRTVIAASDVVLTASGTATLETMLLKRPMVVAYRLATLTYWLARCLVHVRYFSLPNLLTQQPLVPEFLQYQVTPENLGAALLHWIDNPEAVNRLQNQFAIWHHRLRQGADQQAAAAVLDIIHRK